jgi:hypothetical protein
MFRKEKIKIITVTFITFTTSFYSHTHGITMIPLTETFADREVAPGKAKENTFW